MDPLLISFIIYGSAAVLCAGLLKISHLIQKRREEKSMDDWLFQHQLNELNRLQLKTDVINKLNMNILTSCCDTNDTMYDTKKVLENNVKLRRENRDLIVERGSLKTNQERLIRVMRIAGEALIDLGTMLIRAAEEEVTNGKSRSTSAIHDCRDAELD